MASISVSLLGEDMSQKQRRLPKTNTNKKNKISILIENQIRLHGELLKLKRDIYSLVETEVKKNFDDKIEMIDAALKESILHKEILINKGFFTREEVNQKYEELRKKENV